MPQGTLITTPATLADANQGGSLDGCRQMFVMSDGRRVAFYGADDTAGDLHIKTSSDGLIWTAATSPAVLANVINLQQIVQNGDTLYLWWSHPAGQVYLTTVSYTAGSQTFSATQLLCWGWNPVPASPINLGAAWDPTYSTMHVAHSANGRVSLAHGGNSFVSPVYPIYTGTSPVVRDVVRYTGAGASTILVLISDTSGLYVVPCTYNGTATYGAPEKVTGASITGAAASLDASNVLDVLYVSGGGLYAVRRTGTSVYGATANLAAAVGSASLSLTPNGADLIVLFQSVVNYSSGELYLAWRTGGQWGPTRLLAGGDAGGYSLPKAAASLTSGRLDVIYQASGGVYYRSTLAGGAPDAPVISAPSGNVAGLTPSITGTCGNTGAPNDPIGAVEYRVTRVSDSVVMWDSGWITAGAINNVYGANSNTADPNYIAPQALSYGIAYSVAARCKDSFSLPAVAGAWSAGTSFTPQQAGTATIVSISDNSVVSNSSPATIQTPVLDNTVISWSHPAGHAASQYRRTLYAADGVTVVQQEAWTTIAGNLASGSQLTLPQWNMSLAANSTTYMLGLDLMDATSSVDNSATQWQLVSSWAPPAAPTGFTATPQPAAGYTALQWTNNPSGQSVLVQRAPHGTTNWTTLYNGSLRTALNDWADLAVAFDYQVINFDNKGVPSAPATASNITLGANGMFGMSIVDTTNTAVQVWLGVVDQWEDATKFEEPDDVLMFVPLGNDTPIQSFRNQDYQRAGQRQMLVPVSGTDANGTVIPQATTIATLRALRKAHNPCLYRDIDGNTLYVTVSNVSRATANNMWPLKRVWFDLVEVAAPPTPLVS